MVYPEPVHYLANGRWEDIDNTLDAITEHGHALLRNRANGLSVTLPQTYGRQACIQLDAGGHTLSWRLMCQRHVGDVAAIICQGRSPEVTYPNIKPGVSAKYSLRGDRVKEDIIVGDPAALADIGIEVTHTGAYLAVNDDQSVSVLDATTQAELFTFEPPLCYDANNTREVATVRLQTVPDSQCVTRLYYELSADYLTAAAWPITIDPVVHSSQASNDIADNYVDSKQPSTVLSNTRTYLRVAKNSSSYGTCYAYIRHKDLPELDGSCTITKAYMKLALNTSATSAGFVGVHEVTEDWSVTNIKYNNRPGIDDSVIDYAAIESGASSGTLCEFDISNLVRKWYSSGVNRGVMLESLTDGVKFDFKSSDASGSRPLFIINYISNAGTFGYTEYDSHDLGRAGSGAVNLHNGNLVFTRALTATSGSRLPVSVAAHYNSCWHDQEGYSANLGPGWRLNCDQRVFKQTIGSTTYYVQQQGDGTRHYYQQQSGSTSKYEDMSGLTLTLTVGSSEISIADKQGNVSKYASLNSADEGGRLTSITDAAGNKATFTYSSGVLSSITDGAGRITRFTYASGKLSAVKAPGESVGTRLEYVSGRLANVTDADNAHTSYEYLAYTADSVTSYLLHTVVKVDETRMNYSYEGIAPHRLTQVYWVKHGPPDSAGLDDGLDDVTYIRMYRYGDNMTTILDDMQGYEIAEYDTAVTKQIYHFNDYGNVTSVQDALGYGEFASFPGANLPNHPAQVSKVQRVVMNELPNHNFETDADWWFSNDDGGSGSMTYSTSAKMLGKRSVRVVRNSTTGQQSVYIARTLPAYTTFCISTYMKGEAGMYGRIRVNSNDQSFDAEGTPVNLTDDWQRVSIAFTTASEQLYWISMLTSGSEGTAYIDCAQLEQGIVPNQYNILENPDFTRINSDDTPCDWIAQPHNNGMDVVVVSTDPLHPAFLSNNMMRLHGTPDKQAGVYQTLPLSGNSGDVYVVGGWARTGSRPVRNYAEMLSIRVGFKVSGTYQYSEPVVWSDEWHDWHYAAGVVIAPGDYTELRYFINYKNNVNYAYFDGMVLYKEEFGSSFVYDDAGNVLSSSTLTGAKSNAVYDTYNNMTSYRQPGRASADKYTLSYGSSPAKRQLNSVTSPQSVISSYDYDDFGNTKLSRVRNSDRSLILQSSAEHGASENYNYLTRALDSREKATQYVHDTNDSTLTSMTLPNGQAVNYQYDTAKRLTQAAATAAGKTYKNTYTYANDRINTIAHNTTSDTPDVIYSFEYDEIGNNIATKVGNSRLVENEYSYDRTLLSASYFGNGTSCRYGYDEYDRLTSLRLDNDSEPRYEYWYGADGNVRYVRDNSRHSATWTEYDLASRPARLHIQPDNSGVFSGMRYDTQIGYDAYNNISSFKELVAGGRNYETSYVYDKDNRPTTVQFGSSTRKVVNTYDGVNRVKARAVHNGSSSTADLTTNYTFLAGPTIDDYGTSRASTTPLVSKLAQQKRSFMYQYDATTSNLTQVRHMTSTSTSPADKYTYYVYDSIGQLIRVNDQTDTSSGSSGTTWVYEYDRGGNITAKKRYAYTTGSLGAVGYTTNYTYGDGNWKDKVTYVGSVGLLYDDIGNLTQEQAEEVIEGGTRKYVWKAGRQLAELSIDDRTQVIGFEYDHSGLRVQKRASEGAYVSTTDYLYNGAMLVHLTNGGNELHFYYDASGHAAMVNYNGTMYVYLHNLQGDVIGLLDPSGNLVVEYKYDAWGQPTATGGSMMYTLGVLNPFRYRGYVYDEETGLYYLRSRYYNPEWGRFISADDRIQPSGLIGLNVYTYANNKPTMQADPDGTSAISALIAGAAIFGAVAATVISGIKAISRKVSEKKAKANLNKYMGAGFSNGISGKFKSYSGTRRITTQGASARNSALSMADVVWGAIVGSVVSPIVKPIAQKVIPSSIQKIANAVKASESMVIKAGSAIASSIIDSIAAPFSSMYGVRDGDYHVDRYEWTNIRNIWTFEIPISVSYFEVRDYGGGYVEVWQGETNYLSQSMSMPLTKIQDGLYE